MSHGAATMLNTPRHPNHTDRYPQHVDIDDPEEVAFWERWAKVGDAKAAVAEAFEVWRVANEDYVECRRRHFFLTGEKLAGPWCGCADNSCLARSQQAVVERDALLVKVDEAIADFKTRGEG